MLACTDRAVSSHARPDRRELWQIGRREIEGSDTIHEREAEDQGQRDERCA
jgi:hypothetical protein